jgi:hypothetical protein
VRTHQDRRLAEGVSRLEAAIAAFQQATSFSEAFTLAREAEELFAQLLKERGATSSLNELLRGTEAIHRHLFPASEPDAEWIRRRATDAGGSKPWEDAEGVLTRAISDYWRLGHSLTPSMEAFEHSRAGRLRCVEGPWDGTYREDPGIGSYPYPDAEHPTAYYNPRSLNRGDYEERVLMYEPYPATTEQ